ncbi:MAG: TIGR02678 family protein [Firmicutes bacterium]|nr:TIGR02678 family protein [Bacillota bacterium]
MKEFEALLENYWIIKEQDKELYQTLKDASPRLKPFLESRLGYRLLINPYLIKLEKLPGKVEGWMGIEEFEDRLEYAFLCLLLVFLEDYGVQEQFVLSQVTEFIQSTFPGEEKIDWTLYRHRKYLVKVLNFAANLGLIRVDDGDDRDFTMTVETEVLYENTGVSRYFVRNFSRNILSYANWRDLEDDEWLEMDRERGAVRRHRVYRRIFLSPAVYAEGADDPDFLYIKNFRSTIQKEIEDYLESQLHVHKNSAFLVLNGDKQFKSAFPEQKTISAIVLQVNAELRRLVSAGELQVREDDLILISRNQLERVIDHCRKEFSGGWSKEFREMPDAKLYEEVIAYMSGFSMLEPGSNRQELRLLPLAGKATGRYPEDFGGEARE